MGNATWVCFDCREAVRRPTHCPNTVPCPQCSRACRYLGTKIRIPANGEERAWRALRARIREQLHADQKRSGHLRVLLRHRLERRLANLEACPPNKGLARTLQLLRERVFSL